MKGDQEDDDSASNGYDKLLSSTRPRDVLDGVSWIGLYTCVYTDWQEVANSQSLFAMLPTEPDPLVSSQCIEVYKKCICVWSAIRICVMKQVVAFRKGIYSKVCFMYFKVIICNIQIIYIYMFLLLAIVAQDMVHIERVMTSDLTWKNTLLHRTVRGQQWPKSGWCGCSGWYCSTHCCSSDCRKGGWRHRFLQRFGYWRLWRHWIDPRRSCSWCHSSSQRRADEIMMEWAKATSIPKVVWTILNPKHIPKIQ